MYVIESFAAELLQWTALVRDRRVNPNPWASEGGAEPTKRKVWRHAERWVEIKQIRVSRLNRAIK